MSQKRTTLQDSKTLRFREVVVPDGLRLALTNAANSYVRSYTLGECTVLVTREFGK